MPEFSFKGLSIEELRNLPFEGKILCLELSKHWSFMPNGCERGEAPFLPKNGLDIKEATFFGGTFNPWHAGHRVCLDLCPAENIIVVPDSNPWKTKSNSLGPCPWQSYLDLCEELKETPYSIYPGFCGMEEANPTIGWLPKVELEKKSLLVGDDNFLSFTKWKDYKELILELDTLYTTPRLGKREELEKMREHLRQINPKLKIEFLEHHNYESLSSTQLREDKKKGS